MINANKMAAAPNTPRMMNGRLSRAYANGGGSEHWIIKTNKGQNCINGNTLSELGLIG